MAKLNRNHLTDAEKYINQLLARYKEEDKRSILDFLSEQIRFAHKTCDYNWNLNLDKNGRFLRFNIGQEYSINIKNNELLVLCLTTTLPSELQEGNDHLTFLGKIEETSKEEIHTRFDKIIYLQNKVKHSVGVNFYQDISNLWKTQESNETFIKYAIEHTKILPAMRQAHSIGAITYLAEYTSREVPNPLYVEEAFIFNEELEQQRLKSKTEAELLQLLKNKPENYRTQRTSLIYQRDTNVKEIAMRRAKGICQDCKKPAPFASKHTGEPFLEVHHIEPLAQGGRDTEDNVLALCPNCHRERHYG